MTRRRASSWSHSDRSPPTGAATPAPRPQGILGGSRSALLGGLAGLLCDSCGPAEPPARDADDSLDVMGESALARESQWNSHVVDHMTVPLRLTGPLLSVP